MNDQAHSPVQSHKKRLFFALWPDEAEVKQIQEHTVRHLESCQGRILDAYNWHITLAYFGAADRASQQCMEQQADIICAQPFELELVALGFWPQPKVAWLAPEVVPAELKQLASDLQLALVPCGYTPETREYQPHLTLVRKARQAPAITHIAPIRMKVRQFCLVESRTSAEGADYYVLKRWDFKTL